MKEKIYSANFNLKPVIGYLSFVLLLSGSTSLAFERTRIFPPVSPSCLLSAHKPFRMCSPAQNPAFFTEECCPASRISCLMFSNPRFASEDWQFLVMLSLEKPTKGAAKVSFQSPNLVVAIAHFLSWPKHPPGEPGFGRRDIFPNCSQCHKCHLLLVGAGRATGKHQHMEKETKPASHRAGAQGAGLVLGIPRVELGQGALGDPLEHLLGEDPEELPADVQRLVHCAVLVGPCRDSPGRG